MTYYVRKQSGSPIPALTNCRVVADYSIMPLTVFCTIFAYLMATACAIVLMKRSSNWRIRFLSFAIGLAPLCQSIVLLGNQHIWITSDVGHTAESLQLSDSALCLAALHLLNKENRDRRGTDTRLRVAEANSGWPIATGVALQPVSASASADSDVSATL